MKISILICTRNRANAIAGALDSIQASIAAAALPGVELIVVDNGSTDGTAGELKRWRDTQPHDCSITILHEARPGLATARNAALGVARGEILIFTDDDCRLDPGYLPDLLRHYSADAGPVIRGGRVELGDPADLPFTIKTDTDAARLAYGCHPGGFVNGCNMTMHRQVVDRIGLFDERFGAGARFRSAEDTDFLFRAQLAGIPVEYVPDMVIYHHHGRRRRDAIQRLHAAYHFGNGALYAKHLLRGPRLLRHLWWDARSALREALGGPNFEPGLGLTYRAIVAGNIAGMVAFWLGVLRREVQA